MSLTQVLSCPRYQTYSAFNWDQDISEHIIPGKFASKWFHIHPINTLPSCVCFCTNSRWFDASIVCMYNKHDNDLAGGENNILSSSQCFHVYYV